MIHIDPMPDNYRNEFTCCDSVSHHIQQVSFLAVLLFSLLSLPKHLCQDLYKSDKSDYEV